MEIVVKAQNNICCIPTICAGASQDELDDLLDIICAGATQDERDRKLGEPGGKVWCLRNLGAGVRQAAERLVRTRQDPGTELLEVVGTESSQRLLDSLLITATRSGSEQGIIWLLDRGASPDVSPVLPLRSLGYMGGGHENQLLGDWEMLGRPEMNLFRGITRS